MPARPLWQPRWPNSESGREIASRSTCPTGPSSCISMFAAAKLGAVDRPAQSALHRARAAVHAPALRGHGRRSVPRTSTASTTSQLFEDFLDFAPRPAVPGHGRRGGPVVRRPDLPVRGSDLERRRARPAGVVDQPAGGPVRHPVHVGHDGQAEGRGAHASQPAERRGGTARRDRPHLDRCRDRRDHPLPRIRDRSRDHRHGRRGRRPGAAGRVRRRRKRST